LVLWPTLRTRRARTFCLRHEFARIQDQQDKLFIAMAAVKKEFSGAVTDCEFLRGDEPSDRIEKPPRHGD
jgi:hypothetical protein